MLTIVNDSVFGLQGTESVDGMASVVSLEYVKRANHDTTRYRAFFDGDVILMKAALRLSRPYYIASGTFDNCILYAYDIYPEHYREIVSPRTGMIALEIQADSIPRFSPAWQWKIELVYSRVLK